MLESAGINPADCIFDTVFKFSLPFYDHVLTKERALGHTAIPPLKPGHYLKLEHAPALTALRNRIEAVKPNIVIALGDLPMWALTHYRGIKRWRGAPILTIDQQQKVLPTWAPDSVLKNWALRPIVILDLSKALYERQSPLLIRPARKIYLQPTLADLTTFYEEHIKPAPYLAADIETKNFTITEIGFAPSPSRALVIPFWSRQEKDGNYWRTFEEEKAAWEWVRMVCATKPLVGQNFQYDMHYLTRTMGIATPLVAGDTMLLHHSLQPELQKGLGFLGSIYTREPSWKFMRTDHQEEKRNN
jgi:hypothetical protein